jgi:sigma-B regulation protein RsbU (phosphoserine phosphatase)
MVVAKVAQASKTRKSAKATSSEIDLIREVEDLGCEFCSPLEPQGVMDALVNRIVERYPVQTAAIWKLNDTGSILELGASAGSPELPPSLHTATLDQTLMGKVVRDREPQMYTADHANGDELAAWSNNHGLGFVAVYPLLQEPRVRGVLMLASSKTPPDSLLALLRLHARLASVALRDAELFSSTVRTLTKLSFLVEASKALGSTLDLAELLGRILHVAKTHSDAERGTLFLVDYKTDEIWSLIAHGLEKQEIRLPLGLGIAGHVAKTGEILNIPDAYADARFNREVDKKTGYRTRNILCLPIKNKGGKIIAALQLLNKKQGAFSDEDTEFLLTLSGHMALALENAQLHKELLEKERLEREMALARGIQRSLLPESTPLVQGFDIALLNEPCFEVGGDYYDFLSLGPNTLLVVIADVEGKGISSAMVMSNLQATLRALVLHLHSLNDIAEALNKMILTDTRGGKYLSMFLGLLDVRRKSIHYINCGHVPPAIVRPDAEPILLKEGGMVIGLFDNVPYERGQTRFHSGDVLVLCTDGITEAMDAQQDEYGLDRLVNCVREAANGSAAEIVKTVSADVARFSREGTHLDDKVMIAIKVA